MKQWRYERENRKRRQYKKIEEKLRTRNRKEVKSKEGSP